MIEQISNIDEKMLSMLNKYGLKNMGARILYPEMSDGEMSLFVDLKDQHTVDITFKELTKVGTAHKSFKRAWIKYRKFHGLL
jgi:hypothetical protein